MAERPLPLILPELVSGRGTARRSRVVEGKSRSAWLNDVRDNRLDILERLTGGDAQRRHTLRREPSIAFDVGGRAVASIMRLAINLDRKPRVAAIKVEDVAPARMLTAEFDTARPRPEHAPQHYFRQRHLSAQTPRVGNGASFTLRCDVLEHGAVPSTMLRMVPLPETSSGRISTESD